MTSTELLLPKEATEVLHRCIFGLSDSLNCSSNFAQMPTQYFSLGEAIGALALIFAVYQLSQPAWKIVQEVRGFFSKNAIWIFTIAGLAMIFFSYMLPQLPLRKIYPFGGLSSTFFEGLAFILFAIAPFSLYLSATRQRFLFNEKNADRFWHALLTAVANSKSGYLEAAVDIIFANLSELAEAAKRTDEVIAQLKNNPKHEDVECRSAYAVLNEILSEPRVVEYICTSRLDFLYAFFSLIHEKHLPYSAVGLSVTQLVNFLLTNKESYLYQQLKRGGFAESISLYEHIFFESREHQVFGLLEHWRSFGVEYEDRLLDKDYLSVYLRALEQTCRGYWISDSRSSISPNALYRCFERLRDYIKAMSYLVDKKGAKGEAAFWRLNEVSSFIQDWLRIYDEAVKAGTVLKHDIDVKMDRGFPESMTGELVTTIHQFLTSLPFVDKPRETRILANNFRELLGFIIKPEHQSMRRALLEMIWEQIRENVEKGFYPALLKTYLAIMWYPANYPDYVAERNKLVDYVDSTLIPKLEAGAIMIDGTLMETALLPPTMFFPGKGAKHLVWKDSSGKNRSTFEKT